MTRLFVVASVWVTLIGLGCQTTLHQECDEDLDACQDKCFEERDGRVDACIVNCQAVHQECIEWADRHEESCPDGADFST